ncbi:hypothetical protein ES703_13304 [subsurface metagenome]
MSLFSDLGLAEPGTEEETQPGLPILSLCWDPLFAFLTRFFKPKVAKAWTVLHHLEAETSTNYKLVFKAEVEAGFEGALDMITLYSDRPAATQWRLEIVSQEQFVDKKTFVALTLSYNGLTIRANQVIKLMVKTDGVATNISGGLSGQLRYLGG